MGRETIVVCEWLGQRAEVKALLESTEIILRGEIKAKIPRSSITTMKIDGDTLAIKSAGKTLLMELGTKEAAKWLEILSKPPPGLADKLGLSASRKAYVLGKIEDQELSTALKGNQSKDIAGAGLLLALINSPADLRSAFQLAKKSPALMLWCIYPKGKSGGITDGDIRTFMREHGYVDNKACAVSATLTATRYGFKK